MTTTNTFSTTFCQAYIASNPEVESLLIQVSQALKIEHNLVDAGFQFETLDWQGNPNSIRWQLKVGGTPYIVGELVHYIFDSSCGFSFQSHLDEDGEEFISTGDRIHSKLDSMSQAWMTKDDIMDRLKD